MFILAASAFIVECMVHYETAIFILASLLLWHIG